MVLQGEGDARQTEEKAGKTCVVKCRRANKTNWNMTFVSRRKTKELTNCASNREDRAWVGMRVTE